MKRKRIKYKSGTPSPSSKKQENMAICNTKQYQSQQNDLINLEEVLCTENDEGKLYNVLFKLCESINQLGRDTKAIRKSQDTLHCKLDQLEWKINSLEEFRVKTEPQIDNLIVDCSDLKKDIDNLKEEVQKIDHFSGTAKEEEYSPDVTVVGMRIPFVRGEDIFMKSCDLIYNHLNLRDIKIIRAMHTAERNGRPGIVKIQLGSVTDKVKVLREKSKLAKSDGEYRNVYLRSSKTHTERLVDLNFRTLLHELPNGKNYRVAGNGRVIIRDDGTSKKQLQTSQSQRNPLTMDATTTIVAGSDAFDLFSQKEFPPMSQANNIPLDA